VDGLFVSLKVVSAGETERVYTADYWSLCSASKVTSGMGLGKDWSSPSQISLRYPINLRLIGGFFH